MSAEVREALAGLDARAKHLDFQMKRAQPEDLQKLEAESRKIIESRKILAERLKEIGRFVDGQEVVHGRVESFVEVKIGDRWDWVMSVELVLQDGQVVEIRRGGLL